MALPPNSEPSVLTPKQRCPWCRQGMRIARDAGGLWWYYQHRESVRIYCPASRIRERP